MDKVQILPVAARVTRLIHVIDADVNNRQRLLSWFSFEGFQTTWSPDATSALRNMRARLPDLAIIDLDLPDVGGLDVLRCIKSFGQPVATVMMANKTALNEGVVAMKLGAVDVVSKPVNFENLSRLVGETFKKDIILTHDPDGGQTIDIMGFRQLTPREREVLHLIVNGTSNKLAARDLQISPRTVEVHRARIMQKLGARNAADLVRKVLTA